MSHPERIVPDETDSGIVALHAKRYEFALPQVEGRVLDAATGVGYGAALLAERAQHVIGVDIDRDAVAYARERYRRSNLEFCEMDVTALAFDDRSFDVVVSFETIEHLDDPEAAVREAARVLRDDGTYFVSTPRAEATTHDPENPFHRVELSVADFELLLRRHFGEVSLFGQRRLQTTRHRLMQRVDVLGLRRRFPLLRRAAPLLGTRPMAALTAADVVISPTQIGEASELVAACRSPRR